MAFLIPLIPEAIELGEAGVVAYRAYRLARAAQAAARLARAAQALERLQAKEASKEGCATCPKQEVPCFNTPEGGDDAEMDRQLKEQQDGINKMSPDELLGNMAKNRDAAGNVVRPAGDATKRAQVRRQAEIDKATELDQLYRAENRPAAQALKDAARDAADWIKDKAALHKPDIVAGGDGTISGVGNASVNSSIRSQWSHAERGSKGGQTRAQVLESEARNAKARGDKKMNVELERCGKATS